LPLRYPAVDPWNPRLSSGSLLLLYPIESAQHPIESAQYPIESAQIR